MCILTFTHAPSQHHLIFKWNHSSVEYCLREIFFIKLVFDIHSNSASKHTFLEELNSLRIIIINARSYFIVLWRGISTGPLVIVIHSTRAMNYFLDKSSKHNCDEANDPAPRNSASRGFPWNVDWWAINCLFTTLQDQARRRYASMQPFLGRWVFA